MDSQPTHQLQDEALLCQFSSWYPIFRHLPAPCSRSNVTIKSEILSLPSNFREYLLSDGVRLPVGATALSSCIPDEADRIDDWSDDEDEGTEQFAFVELNQQIEKSISSLGGAVVPKLNWSAPKDATWVNNGTLKCEKPGDVYLLLKSSDFCLHDVHQTGEGSHLELVLRKWCNLHPSMEFRCFVRRHQLIAISQRNHSQHFPHLLRDRYMFRSLLVDFFDDVVHQRFADGRVENYVFDTYIDQKERVWLLDFNVWGRQTDSLLWEWDELEQPVEEEDNVEVRVVETDREVRQDPLASYRAPIDTVDIATMTGGDSQKFQEFMSLCEKPSHRDDGST